MDYVLAKQLKEAGFWQDGLGFYISESGRTGVGVFSDEMQRLAKEIGDAEEWAYQPPLHELLEACGDNYLSLERRKHGWMAATLGNTDPLASVATEHYSTPEEAIARLWLALNPRAV